MLIFFCLIIFSCGSCTQRYGNIPGCTRMKPKYAAVVSIVIGMSWFYKLRQLKWRLLTLSLFHLQLPRNCYPVSIFFFWLNIFYFHAYLLSYVGFKTKEFSSVFSSLSRFNFHCIKNVSTFCSEVCQNSRSTVNFLINRN